MPWSTTSLRECIECELQGKPRGRRASDAVFGPGVGAQPDDPRNLRPSEGPGVGRTYAANPYESMTRGGVELLFRRLRESNET